MALGKGRIAFIGAGVLLGSLLLLEAVSIEEWNSTTVPGGGRIGMIHYRDTWGDLNRVTMRLNEWLLWIGGYEMTGAASYGHFGVWMHAYRER